MTDKPPSAMSWNEMPSDGNDVSVSTSWLMDAGETPSTLQVTPPVRSGGEHPSLVSLAHADREVRVVRDDLAPGAQLRRHLLQ
jgi:hypothetical protein